MPDFSKRSEADELMDDFELDHQVIDPIMDELEVINKLLGGYSVFFNAFAKLPLQNNLIIADWGCGGGDSLRVLAKWARKRKLNWSFVGIDATASAIEYARSKAKDYPEITFLLADVLSGDLQTGQFDITISSLFTHHFKDEDWIKLIREMTDCSRLAVVVNDLHRHWFAYYSIGVLTSVFSNSALVKHDSKVSVLRSFRRNELARLLAEAGIKNYSLNWKWAFRWQLIIHK